MHTMKITAGLGCADDYIRFCEAGADECFCGYVPLAWAERYGLLSPLNRREVNFYNVQIGAKSELEILRGMVQAYGKRVHLTFNSLYYTPEQYSVLADIIAQCMELGFESFILADPALLVYLRRNKSLRGGSFSPVGAFPHHLSAEEQRRGYGAVHRVSEGKGRVDGIRSVCAQ